ncbi:MAG: cation diffusion facilitator family transporter [Opitutales bacterium]
MAKEIPGIRTTQVGLVLNLLLGFVKCVAGWWLGSKALLADGAHSLLDLLTDIAVLLGLAMADKPEDDNHLYGHHKFASLAKFFVGAVLLLFSLALVVSAVFDFRQGAAAVPKAGPAVLIALAGLVIKEALYWWTRAVARRTHSDLLMANALHHRMDSLSSVGVAAALFGVWVGGPDWAFLDVAVTLVLGCYLVFESAKVLRRAINELLDAAPEREIIEDFREHILPTPGVVAYHDFRVRRVGDVFEVDLHLQVDPELTVVHGHDVAGEVKQRLREKHPEISKVLVHVEPAVEGHLLKRGLHGVEGLGRKTAGKTE